MKLRKNAVYRVLRGGSYYFDSWEVRVTYRYRFKSMSRDWPDGFRFVIRGKK
jgi:hypothetical protein